MNAERQKTKRPRCWTSKQQQQQQIVVSLGYRFSQARVNCSEPAADTHSVNTSMTSVSLSAVAGKIELYSSVKIDEGKNCFPETFCHIYKMNNNLSDVSSQKVNSSTILAPRPWPIYCQSGADSSYTAESNSFPPTLFQEVLGVNDTHLKYYKRCIDWSYL